MIPIQFDHFACESHSDLSTPSTGCDLRCSRPNVWHDLPNLGFQDMENMQKNFRLPDGSCDCHVHIYGPYERFPAAEDGRFTPTQPNPVESLFAMWESIGISRGVIVHALAAGPANEVTLDALRRYPERLRGVAVLQPDVIDRRLDEMTDAGFKGARINMLLQDGKPVSAGGMDFRGLEGDRAAARGWHAKLWIETGWRSRR
jgi:2-pyrone-4,6-dicarboxylate lactonase